MIINQRGEKPSVLNYFSSYVFALFTLRFSFSLHWLKASFMPKVEGVMMFDVSELIYAYQTFLQFLSDIPAIYLPQEHHIVKVLCIFFLLF